MDKEKHVFRISKTNIYKNPKNTFVDENRSFNHFCFAQNPEIPEEAFYPPFSDIYYFFQRDAGTSLKSTSPLTPSFTQC